MSTGTSAVNQAKSRAALLKKVRQFHTWMGTFFAPAILFFAFTGLLQTFSLHEGRPGGSYQPPAWIVKMAQIHKKQNLATREERPPRGADAAKQNRRSPDAEPSRQPQPNLPVMYLLKWFVTFMSLGLMATTALGIYMAFQLSRDTRVTWALLILGTVLPAALLIFV